MDHTENDNVNYDLNQIKELLNQPIRPDHKWSIYSKVWIEKCLAFLGTPDDETKHPGPVDNSRKFFFCFLFSFLNLIFALFT